MKSYRERVAMACGLPGVVSSTGNDPTLPRDGTDFITLQVVMYIGVWLRLSRAVTPWWAYLPQAHPQDTEQIEARTSEKALPALTLLISPILVHIAFVHIGLHEGVETMRNTIDVLFVPVV